MEKICVICIAKKPFFTCRFICKNNGVLFENDLLQIGVKSEYRQNLGRLGIFYGNKTSFQFSGFSIDTQCPGELASHILYFTANEIKCYEYLSVSEMS